MVTNRNSGWVVAALVLTLIAGRAHAQDAAFLKTFGTAALKQHNMLRAKHRSPALSLDETLRLFAQKHAGYLAARGSLEHSKGSGYGENLYMIWSSGPGCSNATALAEQAVNSWYAEIKDYNWNTPTFSMKTGHFTQVVWKGSTKVGCGAARATDGKTCYAVCEYSPPGNMMGAFAQNVPRLM